MQRKSPLILYTQLMQYVFHQAPLCDGALEQVGPNKKCEPKPVDGYVHTQQHAYDDEEACYGPYIPVYHIDLLS